MNGFKINNLKAGIGDKSILEGVNLEIEKGEVHVLMGPNGSGKSSLSQVLMGNPQYEVQEGEILWGEENLLGQDPEIIARKGVFLSFQSPPEVEGVSFVEFLKLAYNNRQKALDEKFSPLKTKEFMKILSEIMESLEMKKSFVKRCLNEGFSGGEKKKSEILQMLLLKPELVVIDEIDSGLDVDALKVVSRGINLLIEQGVTVLLITHYKRILEHITKIDKVHILMNGAIVKSGEKELVDQLESEGFRSVENSQEKENSRLKML